MDHAHQQPPSARVAVRRLAERGRYDRDTVRAVLAQGVIAHVGVTTDDGPLVLPMAYGLGDDVMYLHGAVGNALLRGGAGAEICATVTIVDGLVMARSAFHNSMNYRSVVVRGLATRVTDPDEQLAALRFITDHVVANWHDKRPVTEAEVVRTMILSLPLAEASAKIRSGDPIDDPEDLDGPCWAGTIPLLTAWGTPLPSADLNRPVPVPDAFTDMRQRR